MCTTALIDEWGYRLYDLITEVFRERLNHFTGVYEQDNSMWSPREYDEYDSYQHDRAKDYATKCVADF